MSNWHTVVILIAFIMMLCLIIPLIAMPLCHSFSHWLLCICPFIVTPFIIFPGFLCCHVVITVIPFVLIPLIELLWKDIPVIVVRLVLIPLMLILSMIILGIVMPWIANSLPFGDLTYVWKSQCLIHKTSISGFHCYITFPEDIFPD